MKKFHCQCGQPVLFESNTCMSCNAVLGFNPDQLDMLSLRESVPGVIVDQQGREFRVCDNGIRYRVCNWLKPAQSNHPLCWDCRFNRTIHDLDNPQNIGRWHKLEAGKKRLLYTLLRLGLPPVNPL